MRSSKLYYPIFKILSHLHYFNFASLILWLRLGRMSKLFCPRLAQRSALHKDPLPFLPCHYSLFAAFDGKSAAQKAAKTYKTCTILTSAPFFFSHIGAPQEGARKEKSVPPARNKSLYAEKMLFYLSISLACITFVGMKQLLFFFLSLALLLGVSSCTASSDESKASQMLPDIEASVARGDYRSALDSITLLRSRYPQALHARQRALELWQDASLLQAEAEAARADSLLQVTLLAIDSVPTLLEQNILRNRRDSLQARYDAQMGVIKVIKERQNGAQ